MQVETAIKNKVSEFLKSTFPNAVLNDLEEYQVYTSVGEEYNSLKKGVAVHDISHLGMLKISGKEALEFLHRISTNSIKDLENHHKVATLFINEKGRFIDRTLLLRFENDLLMIGSSRSISKLKLWINRFVVTEDISVEPVNDRWVLFEVLGPQAGSYMTLICGDKLNELNDNNIITVDVDSIKFYMFKKIEPNGYSRFWILSYSVIADKLIEYMLNQKSVFDLNMVGEEAFDIFRIEIGLPKAPNEINDLYNPHETNLASEISFNKGCYIGQEVIARLETYDKVQRTLTSVIFDNEVNPGDEIKIFDDKKNEIGVITSIAKSDLLEKMIGLAYVRKSFIGNGTQFTAVGKFGSTKISVTNLSINQ